jgi:radical SAM protein with 4Fe4S-binding SPASM domain
MIKNRYKLQALKLELKSLSAKRIYNLGLNYLASKTFPAKALNQLTVIQLESTLACNLKCKMCVREYFGEHKAYLVFEEFRKIIDKFPYLRQVNLTGIGEPLLNKDIFRMVDYATKAKSLYVRFTTNATLLNRQNSEKLICSGLNELRVSLDAASAGVFDDIRQGSCFEQVIENIKELNSLKCELGVGHPLVEINTVLMKENIHELPEIVSLAHSLNINSIYCMGLDVEGAKYAQNDNLIYKLGKDEIKVIFNETRKRAQDFGVSIRLPNIVPKRRKCSLPWLTNYVTIDGDLMPCCRCIDGRDRDSVIRGYAFGNLLEQNLADIWNNEKYRHFRKRLNNGHLPYICRNCAVISGMD